LLVDHAHRELEPDLQVEVARHLTQCPTCAVEFCRLQADLEGILDAHYEMPPPRVKSALRRRVAAELAPPWWRRVATTLRRPVPMYGAVLAALVPAVLWFLSAGPIVATRDAELAPSRASAAGPARVTDYDATTVLPAHRDVL
jgi:anti-sigma factor RsiW